MFRKFPRSCNIALSFNIREHPCNDASPDDCTSLSLTLSIKILILSWGVVAFHTIRIMARRYGSALCNESLVELHCHGKRSLFCRSALWNILEATSITVSPLRKLMLIRINLNKNCSCFIFRMASFVILGYRIEISLVTFNFCFFFVFFFLLNRWTNFVYKQNVFIIQVPYIYVWIILLSFHLPLFQPFSTRFALIGTRIPNDMLSMRCSVCV